MHSDSAIFVAGHNGLVGSAIVRSLTQSRYTRLILRDREQLNLLNQSQVEAFFRDNEIEYVLIAAARVGGIEANRNNQADFLYENLVIATNLIQAAAQKNVAKLLFLGSSCIYPKLAPQPISEDSLLSGPLEPTNEGYAIAKIAGLKLCEHYHRQYGKQFISAMPTNLYGPNDNFHPMDSHVIPGMMRRFHEAKVQRKKEVVLWGSGTAKRDFVHVDDLAEALELLMAKYDEPETINIGSGSEVSISELAHMMKEVVEFDGNIVFDTTKPDGTPRKILDISKISKLGWAPRIELKQGLKETYDWACTNGVLDSILARR